MLWIKWVVMKKTNTCEWFDLLGLLCSWEQNVTGRGVKRLKQFSWESHWLWWTAVLCQECGAHSFVLAPTWPPQPKRAVGACGGGRSRWGAGRIPPGLHTLRNPSAVFKDQTSFVRGNTHVSPMMSCKVWFSPVFWGKGKWRTILCFWIIIK